jgi:Histidine phosphatase superfamily (branch 2)
MQRRRISTILLLVIVASMVNSEVVMVFEYCRHGARGSLADLQNGSQWIKDWGVEQLTGNGMRMQHYLGKTMRTVYPSIFDKDFKPAHMEAYATNFNRTIASGLSQFTGLFDMFQGPELQFDEIDPRLQPPKLTIDPKVGFKTALPKGYTPIPIISKLNQRKMQIKRDDCPYGNERALAAKASLGDYLMKQPKILELIKQGAQKYGITDLSEINLKAKGKKIIDIETLFFLGDFAMQDYLHNLHPLIPKFDEGGQSQLYHQLEAGYSLATIARFNDTEFTSVIISEILYEIKDLMNKKISDAKYDKRFILYSGHDDMMSALLQAIGYLDPQCLINSLVDGEYKGCTPTPDLASTIVWELHKENDGHFIKVKYNADWIDFCGLYNQENEFKCTLEEFSKRIDDIGRKDYKDWCIREDEKKIYLALEETWKYVSLALLFILVIMVVVCSVLTYKLYKKTSDISSEYLKEDDDQYMSMATKSLAN